MPPLADLLARLRERAALLDRNKWYANGPAKLLRDAAKAIEKADKP